MKRVNKNLPGAASLRKKTEEQLKKKHSKITASQPEADTLKLLHELEVHQIELEMQNEELRLEVEKAATATALYDFAPAGYFTLGRDGTIGQLNLRGAWMLGKEHAGLLNSNFKLFVTWDTLPVFNDFLQKVFETDSKQACEVRLLIQSNSSIFVHLQGIITEDEQKCLVTAVDITEHKHAEEKIINLNRVYAIVSQINQAIVRERDKDKLLTDICNIPIEFGKLRMAWIGLVDEETKLVQPVAFAGVENGYLSAIKKISLSDTPEGHGPTGTAIRAGEHFVCNDIETDPVMAVWKEEALKRGYRSSIALPITLLGKVIGAFSLYSSLPYFFDQQEIRLLDEVANDLSFALEALETEKKRKETLKALLESQENLKKAQEIAKLGSWQLDIESDTLSWSDEIFRLFEIDPEKFRANYEAFLDASHPDDRTMINKVHSDSLQNKTPYEIDHRVLMNDGRIKFVHESGTTYYDVNGKPIRSIGTVQDITERMQAEEKIKTLGRAIEQGPSSIVITNAKGEIIFVNDKFTSLTQYQFNEVKGKNPRIFNQGHLSENELEVLWETLQKGAIWKGEVMERRKDQSRFWEEVSISVLINPDGTIGNYILIMNDITEKRQMLDDLIAAKEKAEESDRLKSAFLANMSHEIRTPLNSIIGFSELMVDPDYDPAQQYDFARMINVSGKNLLSIINDIIDISKIEAGQVIIKKTVFSEKKLISDIQKEYGFIATEKGIDLRLDPSNPKKEILIESDEQKLRQILVNLVGNSIKFTKAGFIEIGIKVVGDFVQFHVKDTGIGIPKEFHAQIFERFRQVDSTVTRKYGGNGLGLAISKNLVELLGGTIWMESEEGKGSTFYFLIPFSEKQSSELPKFADQQKAASH